jgi:hypothetical protein
VLLEPALRAELLRLYHNNPLARHFRRAKTLKLLTRLYYWPNIEHKVREYIDLYIDC